jgi:hypothetical protein
MKLFQLLLSLTLCTAVPMYAEDEDADYDMVSDAPERTSKEEQAMREHTVRNHLILQPPKEVIRTPEHPEFTDYGDDAPQKEKGLFGRLVDKVKNKFNRYKFSKAVNDQAAQLNGADLNPDENQQDALSKLTTEQKTDMFETWEEEHKNSTNNRINEATRTYQEKQKNLLTSSVKGTMDIISVRDTDIQKHVKSIVQADKEITKIKKEIENLTKLMTAKNLTVFEKAEKLAKKPSQEKIEKLQKQARDLEYKKNNIQRSIEALRQENIKELTILKNRLNENDAQFKKEITFLADNYHENVKDMFNLLNSKTFEKLDVQSALGKKVSTMRFTDGGVQSVKELLEKQFDLEDSNPTKIENLKLILDNLEKNSQADKFLADKDLVNDITKAQTFIKSHTPTPEEKLAQNVKNMDKNQINTLLTNTLAAHNVEDLKIILKNLPQADINPEQDWGLTETIQRAHEAVEKAETNTNMAEKLKTMDNSQLNILLSNALLERDTKQLKLILDNLPEERKNDADLLERVEKAENAIEKAAKPAKANSTQENTAKLSAVEINKAQEYLDKNFDTLNDSQKRLLKDYKDYLESQNEDNLSGLEYGDLAKLKTLFVAKN